MATSGARRDHAKDAPNCRFCGGRTRFLGWRDGYPFRECEACGFWFTPWVGEAAMRRRYRGRESGSPPGGGWADPAFLAPALARLPPGPLTILDFGAGDSIVPDLLRGQGHRVMAVDLAPPRRPHPDRLTGPLEDLPLAPRSFDLLYAFQVFEHLPHPRPVLDRLMALSRDGGLVAVHTDMEMPERRHGVEGWWYVMPPEHCAFYRHRTFAAYAAATGHDLAYADAKLVLLRARHGQRRWRRRSASPTA